MVILEQFFEDLGHNKIENRDDIGRIRLNLLVELLRELVYVVTVNVQNVSLSIFYHFELLNVIGLFGKIFIVIIYYDESIDKVPHFCGNIISVYICPPKYLSIT